MNLLNLDKGEGEELMKGDEMPQLAAKRGRRRRDH